MSWPVLRAKHLYDAREERVGDADLPLLAVSIHHGVVPRDSLTTDEPRADDLSTYRRCDKGDVVINRMRAFQGGIGLAAQAGAVSPDYLVLRLNSTVEPRFFHHLFRSTWFVGEMTARLRGIGSSDQGNVRTPRINIEDFGEIRVAVPPLDEQREIADFLDAETERIDALVEKKNLMIRLVNERLWSVAESQLATVDEPLEALGHSVVSTCDGPFGSLLTSAHYSDHGARVVRLGNIGRAQFKDQDKAFVPLDHFELLRRHEVIGGDLLVAGLGDSGNPLGRACVAPATLGAAIVKADCFRIRLDTTRLLPEFAAWWLSSDRGGALVIDASRGSTRQRMNVGAVSGVPLPVPSLGEQRDVVASLDGARLASDRTIGAIERQVERLREHRQALITAAVTGQLDVTKAAA